MVEQSTAASHQLRREAAELTELTARFQTGAELDRAETQRTITAAPKTPVHQQRQRVAQFAAQGSARPKATDGWQDF
jgi:hypothetical protein